MGEIYPMHKYQRVRGSIRNDRESFKIQFGIA